MKKCTKCGIDKDLTEFNKSKTFKDGLRYNCKDCEKQYRLERSDIHKQEIVKIGERKVHI